MARTVFVVDDERLLTDTIAAILEAARYQVFAFYDPEDALRGSVGNPPDLLISDFNMPKLTGLQLATQIVNRHANCKVIIMSGVLSSIPLDRHSDGFKFLQKPILPPVLLEEVKASLSER